MRIRSDPPRLYAAREPIFPRRVHGWFRNLKWIIMAVTLAIYYVTPWIRWDRGPGMPDQAVLIDLANRRFYFYWIEIWPHEFYFVAGLLVMAGLGLPLFTSELGRVWCGYACPQTAGRDLFLVTERWVEGDRNARLRLWNAPVECAQAALRLVKWVVCLLISVPTGGAWIFYFTDAPTLLGNLFTGTAHPVAYITMGILTATTFLFGGVAREQICVYACPCPRIQPAMMDEDTLTVAYREWRGEPRGKLHKGEPTKSDGGAKGDCIDCMACVNVCPMGIDIRDAHQLECITCALCIDACDEVMDKIGKPRGLIDYMALKDETAERSGAAPKPVLKHILRPRTMLYFTLWAGIGVALVVALFLRSPFDLNVTPVRNPLYVTMADGAIRNTYALRLRNKQGAERDFAVSVTGSDGAAPQGISLTLEGLPDAGVKVAADSTHTQRVYITAEKDSALAEAAQSELTLWVEDVTDGVKSRIGTVFHGRSE
uniref:CcoG n=1 Tax=Paracoccus denitrificans TaxID=266 RepID=Q51683_PARDE|nr:CcoG [Paracoccus denitrificans PD1222]